MKIKTKKTLSYREDVYCLEVDSTHCFALENGVIAHNCCGHDLAKLLREGFNGVTGRVSSRPPKHFRSALDQMVNYVGILQAEWAGAQAFSSYDTYLAPYVFYDKYMRHMTYTDLKESTLSFVYGLNVPSRWGQCVPSTYRCLRADGKWVGPDDLKVGDEIYVVDMKTGLLKKDKLTKVNTFSAPEKMHRYEAGDNSGFAFEVTDNHRVIYTDPDFTSTVIKNKNSEYIKIAPSASLMSKGTVSIPVAPWGKIDTDHFQGEEYDISDDLLEFIVFIMCDGAIVAQKGKSPYLDWCKSGKRWGTERFKELCKKFGLTYTERGADNGFSNEAKEYRLHVSDKATKIIEMMGKDKHFMPEWFKDLSPRQCYIVIDTWAKLDGYFDGKHWRMQGDTEDIQEMLAYLSVKAGKAAGMMDVNIKDRKNLTKYTAVYLSRFRDCEISEVSPSTDKVWCPTTNTGTFVCMTDDGHIFLTGNSPFSNVTIDWTVPNDLKDQFPMYQDIPYFEAVYKGLTEEDKATPEYECFITAARNKFTKEEYKDIMDCCGPDDDKDLMVLRSLTYKHFQPEMDMINKAFYEVLTEGDPNGLQFTFPIPTINVTEEFDWNSPNADLLFTNTGKYGHSYFQNFIGSQYKRNPETGQLERDPNAYSPNDVRSMCCRLQLDKTQIRKKGGGLFGADSQTGCYDEETEVLTANGWKHFRDITFNDEFYTITPERKIELHKPINLFKYDFDGDMCRFKSDSLDLLVTPNHRMLLTHNGKDKFRFKEAKDCNHTFVAPLTGNWQGEYVAHYVVKAAKRSGRNGKVHSDVKIDMNTWLKFLGLFISEGSVRGSKNGRSNDKYDYEVIITQRKIENISLIDEVMSKMPYNVKKYIQNDTCHWSIRDKSLWEELRPLGCSYQKYIPEYVFKLHSDQLKHLFTYLILGDGHIRKDNGHTEYYTSSVRLKNDVEHLAMLIGYGTNTRENEVKHCVLRGREVVTKHTNYTVSFNIAKNRGVRGYKKEYYKGNVYCVEVPNNTLYVRRNGKTVWCGNSIGVVTINAPRLGYLHKGDKPGMLKALLQLMELARGTLQKKRRFVQEMFDRGLYPYSARYINTLDTFFSTIGILGINEMIRNFTNDEHDITDEYGQEFAKEVLDFMNKHILRFQEEDDVLYNLEAVPGEGTTYRQAKEDLKRYTDIIHAGTPENPYYTNSSQLPVNFTDDAFAALDLQDELQCKYTGGTVLHLYMAEAISDPNVCKALVKKVLTNYRLPYISITPTFSSCPIHGYISGAHDFCPYCDAELIERHKSECSCDNH